jgi:uncharacterized protein
MSLMSSEATHAWRHPLSSPRRLRRTLARPFLAILAFAVLLVSTLAHAAPFTPPPLRGHVVDQAGALTPEQVRQLDRKLDRTRQQTGFAIVVYTLPQLPEGMAIEDVGYKAGNAWGVGSKKGDDGVILIWARDDRKLRIETGKGVGGGLTDIGSSRINREVIGPLLDQGKIYEGLDRGVDAITKELVENTPGGRSDPGRDPTTSRRAGKQPVDVPMTTGDYVKAGAVVAGIIGVIILAIISPTFRSILFWILLFGRFGGRGGGGGGWGGGGGGGGGGSGYGGGGGSFGGGGSSDDY